MWLCFICGSNQLCDHREHALLVWYARLTRDERAEALAQIERKPPARAEAALPAAEAMKAGAP